MAFNKTTNNKTEEKNKLNDYLKLKEEHQKINEESKKLKEYLDVHIFDYAENKHKGEDIFSITNSPLKFADQIRNSEISASNISILEVNHVTKYYASKAVPTLINVSMKVYLGDFHVVVGNYSSGKTTLFNCLNGSEQYEGEIQIDGNLNKGEFCLINEICGFIPYEHKWDKFMTVEDVIFNRFKELNLNETYGKKYVTESLQQLKIPLLRNTLIIDLSLLEIKKVQLIIALINDPHLLVFDQPLLGLQYFEIIELLVLIAKLRTKERTVLVFSHEISDYAKYANTITILCKGKVYYSGSSENLLLTRLHKYSISTSDNELAHSILKEMKTKSSLNEPKNILYAKFDGKLDILSFQKTCAQKNLIITSMTQINVDLEDLYPNLLKTGTKEAIYEINKMHYFSAF